MMKIKPFVFNDVEYEVVKEFDFAYCIAKYGVNTFDLIEEEYSEIKFGKKVFNLKILKTGSVIFTTKKDATNYKAVTTCIYFGFPSDNEVAEIKKLKKISDKALDDINEVLSNIKGLSIY